MHFIAPRDASTVPGVLVAHGYCGSKQLMLGYADTLAHNGYGVLLWDLPGHGGNAHAFEYDTLQSSFELPFLTLKAQPEIDSSQLAVLGHSMGSGIAMEGAIAYDNEIDAVVAISPTGAAVTPNTPKNLSLQLGEWETFLQENANRILNEAGGANSNLVNGQGRSLSTIQNAEHATILFKDQSHQDALNWLNQTFGLDQTNAFRDRRMGWYGLHLLGWLMVLGTVLPALATEKDPPPKIPAWRAWGGLVLSPLIGAGFLNLMGLVSPVENFGGLMIGGALGIWFLVVGVVWAGLIGRLPRLRVKDIGLGLVGFAGLWMGFGAMAQVTWLPWVLTGSRLLLWGLIAIACIPWFLAFSQVLQTAKFGHRFGWWLAQTIAVVGGLILTIIAVPELGFLAIMLPVFPLLFGLFSYVTMQCRSLWGGTISCAFILSWLIVVPFPVL